MIRPARAEDAPRLAALHAASFGDSRWSGAQIGQSLALATTHAFAFEEADAPQGFILCQFAGDEAEILTLCTPPAARRRGIGRALLAAALDEAKKQNITRVFLEVALDNEAALALYGTSGFRPNGTRPDYYRRGDASVDAVMLIRDL